MNCLKNRHRSFLSWFVHEWCWQLSKVFTINVKKRSKRKAFKNPCRINSFSTHLRLQSTLFLNIPIGKLPFVLENSEQFLEMSFTATFNNIKTTTEYQRKFMNGNKNSVDKKDVELTTSSMFYPWIRYFCLPFSFMKSGWQRMKAVKCLTRKFNLTTKHPILQLRSCVCRLSSFPNFISARVEEAKALRNFLFGKERESKEGFLIETSSRVSLKIFCSWDNMYEPRISFASEKAEKSLNKSFFSFRL